MAGKKENAICPVCGKTRRLLDMFAGASIRPALYPFVLKVKPDWNSEEMICTICLNDIRSDYVEQSLISEKGELTDAEKEVVEAIRKQEIVTVEVAAEDEEVRFGDRLSDRLAQIGGSWSFIIWFAGVLIVWISINSIQLFRVPFDPYPYILLNLVLSCIAALQAPVIMMSQNRQEAKDRKRAEADYKTNLKAELEIRHLHIKLDQLITHQWTKLLEVQQVQMDIMKDLQKRE